MRPAQGPGGLGAWLPIALGVVAVVAIGLLIGAAAGIVHLGPATPAQNLAPSPTVAAPLTVGRVAPPPTPAPPTSVPTPRPTATLLPTAIPSASPPPSPTAVTSPTSPAEALRTAALDRVAREGYVVRDPRTYDAGASLRVLLGARNGADDDYRAFFFLNDRYLGTDTLQPSAAPLSVVRQDGSTVALQYSLFRLGDSTCCPSGGTAVVRYRWSGERLEPLDPIPDNQINAPFSRR